MDNSVYKKHDNGFYISGIIEEPKPSFDANENFVLNITLNNSGTISETSTECDIADIIGNNYTLNCQQIRM